MRAHPTQVASLSLNQSLHDLVTAVGTRDHSSGSDVSCGTFVQIRNTRVDLQTHVSEVVGAVRPRCPCGCSGRYWARRAFWEGVSPVFRQHRPRTGPRHRFPHVGGCRLSRRGALGEPQTCHPPIRAPGSGDLERPTGLCLAGAGGPQRPVPPVGLCRGVGGSEGHGLIFF